MGILNSKMLPVTAIWFVIGILLIVFGCRARILYRKKFSKRVEGIVVSSRCDKHYETGFDKPFYDMYVTVNYEVNGAPYQGQFTFINSKKYYQFISQGSYIELYYDPSDPTQVQISRLFQNRGGKRIKWGLILDFLIIFLAWYETTLLK